MIDYFLMLAVLQGSVGASPKEISTSVGAPASEYVHLSPEQLIDIADRLLLEDIAEVDLDPEAFDVPVSRPKKLKKDALDEVEFISERDRLQKAKPVR